MDPAGVPAEDPTELVGANEGNIETHANWRQYSRFYRDRATWEAVGDIVLWQLAREIMLGHQDRPGSADKKITAWSCGCSTGEETFTMQLLWANRVNRHYPQCNFEIIGTDLSHDNIDGASRGLYPPHALVELPPQWVLDWFDEGEPGADGGERFRLSDELRSRTSFVQQDATTQTAETADGRQFDLIVSCYAICLYLDKEQLAECVERLVRNLAPGGFLVVGINDHLPPHWPSMGLSRITCKTWGNQAAEAPVRVYRKAFSSDSPAKPLQQGDNPIDWHSLRTYLEGTNQARQVDWLHHAESKTDLMNENSRRIFQQAVAEGRVPSGNAQHRLVADFKERLRRAIELEQQRALEERHSLFAKSDDAAMARFLERADEDASQRGNRAAEEQAAKRKEEKMHKLQKARLTKVQAKMRKAAKKAAAKAVVESEAEKQAREQEEKEEAERRHKVERRKAWLRRLERDQMAERKLQRDAEREARRQEEAAAAEAEREALLLQFGDQQQTGLALDHSMQYQNVPRWDVPAGNLVLATNAADPIRGIARRRSFGNVASAPDLNAGLNFLPGVAAAVSVGIRASGGHKRDKRGKRSSMTHFGGSLDDLLSIAPSVGVKLHTKPLGRKQMGRGMYQ